MAVDANHNYILKLFSKNNTLNNIIEVVKIIKKSPSFFSYFAISVAIYWR
jgi:hypothetical protein